MLHFSDCQAGAAAGCVAGNNANPGTQALPKRDLSGININALAAGTSLLFKRGGSWNIGQVEILNRNATPDAPITFADWGTGALPLLRVPSGIGFAFGEWGDTVQDGGYTLRNLRFDGVGTGDRAILLAAATRRVLFEGLEISGFQLGIHLINEGAGHAGVTLRNSVLRGNRDHGLLGDANDLLIEGNLIEGNNPDGGGFEHGIYLGGHSSGTTVRNNIFRRNSAPGGTCTGGNFTVHGQYERLTVEGNVIEQTVAVGGCYGFSITAAYNSAEWFRNLVVRGNTIINVGNCAICVSAAPGALIDGNRIFNTMPGAFHVGVDIPSSFAPGAGDAADTGQVIRDNVVCLSSPSSNSRAVVAPASATQSNNVLRTGADATTGVCAR